MKTIVLAESSYCNSIFSKLFAPWQSGDMSFPLFHLSKFSKSSRTVKYLKTEALKKMFHTKVVWLTL
jgi:hypothetical protein